MKAIRHQETLVQMPVKPIEEQYKKAADNFYKFRPYWDKDNQENK